MCFSTEGGEILSAKGEIGTELVNDWRQDKQTFAGKNTTEICWTGRVLSTTPGFVVKPPTSVDVLQDISDCNAGIPDVLAGLGQSTLASSLTFWQHSICGIIVQLWMMNAIPELPSVNKTAANVPSSFICLEIFLICMCCNYSTSVPFP
jgi:hypothetical protein